VAAALITLNTISCFTGSGMLDLGVDLAFERLGYRSNPIAYVEQNEYAQKVILQRQTDGLLPRAAVWADIRTFPATSYRGYAHAVIGGFPCQDVSLAGKREGLHKRSDAGAAERTRSGLFFDLLDVAVGSGAGLIHLENVPGIYSAASPVGDGEYASTGIIVVQALAAAGYRSKWLPLAAEDVGAPHGRERWWCVAWKPVELAHAERHGLAAGAQRGSDARLP
jgi:DNA (cytosine-5)-methyltransferase 1